MRHSPYYGIQVLINPCQIMGQHLSLYEHEMVISTWLWRHYEVTANCYVLDLVDELYSLLDTNDNYSKEYIESTVPKLVDAYASLDAFIRMHTPYINTVQTSYGFYSRTVAFLRFLVPHAGIAYVT